MRQKETVCKRNISDCEEVIPVKLPKRECLFCSRSEVNELELGELITKDDITVHYFCLLLSSGLSQSGKLSNKKAIKGFLQQDILKELKRGSRLRCIFCHGKGATIGCNVGTCKKRFHLPCGRKSGTLHHFFDTFRSFCGIHWPKESVSDSCHLSFSGHGKTECAICLSTVKLEPSSNVLYSPCCTKTWYHRSCIQQHALSAGKYYFKCPICNSLENFQKIMLNLGVYIPNQDASWERQLGAYSELLERHDTCDAPKCKCPHGRNHDEEKGWFDLILCQSCGSFGSHRRCRGLTRVGTSLLCPVCSDFAASAAKEATANHYPAYEGAGPSNVHGSCEGSVVQSQCYPLIVSGSDTFSSATCNEEENLEVDVENSSDVEDVRTPVKKRGRPKISTPLKSSKMVNDSSDSHLTDPLIVSGSDTFSSATCNEEENLEVDVENSSDVEDVRAPVKKRGRPKKSTPLKSSKMVNDSSNSHLTVVIDANRQFTSIQKGTGTKFSRGVWQPSLLPTITIPKIDSLISIPRGTVKLNYIKGWRYNKEAGFLEKKRLYVQSGYYSVKSKPLNVNEGKGSTQKEMNYVSMRRAKHGTLSDKQKTVNQTSKIGGNLFTQLKLDMIWSKVLTIVPTHLNEDIEEDERDAQDIQKVTTDSNLDGDVRTQLNTTSKATDKNVPRLKGISQREVRIKDMLPQLELEFNGATQSGRAAAAVVKRKSRGRRKKTFRKLNLDINCEKELGELSITTEKEMQDTEKICSKINRLTETLQSARESESPLDEFDFNQAAEFDGDVQNEDRISGSQISPAQYKLQDRNIFDCLESTTSLNFKAESLNSVEMSQFSPPSDLKCSNRIGMPEGDLSLGLKHSYGFETPENNPSLKPTSAQKMWISEDNLSLGPTYSRRFVVTPKKDLRLGSTCSNRVEAPEINLSPRPLCSIRTETLENNLSPRPTHSDRIETHENNLCPRPTFSNRIETPENNLCPRPTSSNRIETLENNLSPIPTCSNRIETLENNLFPGPTSSNRIETPENNLCPRPTSSNRIKTPETNLSLGPTYSNMVETPENNLSPRPTRSDRIETPENNLSLRPMCSNRIETPENNLCLGPTYSNRVETPENNLSPGSTRSDKIETPQSDLSLRPVCSNRIKAPENNLSPGPTCSDRIETHENNLCPRPTSSNRIETPETNLSLGLSCSNRVETPENNLSSRPTLSNRIETPENNLSLGPTSSNRIETPENNLSLGPTCSNRVETPENNLSPGPTCSDRIETHENNLCPRPTSSNRIGTPETNLSLGLSCSNRVETPENNLSSRPTLSNRIETPENNLSLGPTSSNRIETPENNLSLGPTCSNRVETPENNLSPAPTRSDRIPTCSKMIESLERDLSLRPMCSNRVETPEYNLLGPTCSNRVETPENNLSPIPTCCDRLETPENNLSPIPTCCDRLETPENNLSPIPTCSTMVEKSEKNLPLRPACSNRVETPEENVFIGPTGSDRFETPGKNLPLGPTCSNSVEIPMAALSQKSDSSTGDKISQSVKPLSSCNSVTPENAHSPETGRFPFVQDKDAVNTSPGAPSSSSHESYLDSVEAQCTPQEADVNGSILQLQTAGNGSCDNSSYTDDLQSLQARDINSSNIHSQIATLPGNSRIKSVIHQKKTLCHVFRSCGNTKTSMGKVKKSKILRHKQSCKFQKVGCGNSYIQQTLKFYLLKKDRKL